MTMTPRFFTATLCAIAFSTALAQPSQSTQRGQAASDGQAERTIEIRPDTRWVNVTRMETIRFVINREGAQKAFTWRFDTLPLRPFELAEVAPQGALGQQQVTVYVARNRDLDGRGGR